MDKVIKLFKDNYVYAFLKDLKTKGVHTEDMRKLVKTSPGKALKTICKRRALI